MQQDDSQRQALQAGVKRESAIVAAAEMDKQKRQDKRATFVQAETTGGTPKDATALASSQNGDRVSFAMKVPDRQGEPKMEQGSQGAQFADLSDDETVATSAQAYNERLK